MKGNDNLSRKQKQHFLLDGTKISYTPYLKTGIKIKNLKDGNYTLLDGTIIDIKENIVINIIKIIKERKKYVSTKKKKIKGST